MADVDRTPEDVLTEGVQVAVSADSIAGPFLVDALAAAGFMVFPRPDDQTRDEVLSLIARVKDRKVRYEVCRRYAIVPEFDHIDLSRLERMAELLERAFLPEGDQTNGA